MAHVCRRFSTRTVTLSTAILGAKLWHWQFKSHFTAVAWGVLPSAVLPGYHLFLAPWFPMQLYNCILSNSATRYIRNLTGIMEGLVRLDSITSMMVFLLEFCCFGKETCQTQKSTSPHICNPTPNPQILKSQLCLRTALA